MPMFTRSGLYAHRVGTGLIASPLWTNDRCRSCEAWQNGTFVISNPATDLGWNVLIDPLVFFLRQVPPSHQGR